MGIARFGQVVIEPSELGDADIARIGVSRQGDGEHAMAAPTRFAHQCVTGAVGQRDIANDDINRWLSVEASQTVFQSVGR